MYSGIELLSDISSWVGVLRLICVFRSVMAFTGKMPLTFYRLRLATLFKSWSICGELSLKYGLLTCAAALLLAMLEANFSSSRADRRLRTASDLLGWMTFLPKEPGDVFIGEESGEATAYCCKVPLSRLFSYDYDCYCFLN